MYSMTGIGFSSAKAKDLTVDITVKSVNGRYLDLRLHLSDAFQILESDIRKIISDKIKRGSVTISMDQAKNGSSDIEIDSAAAEKLFKQLSVLGKKLKLKSDLSLDALTRFPQLLKSNSTNIIRDSDKKIILRALGEALDACNLERKREGQSTQNVFKKLLSELKMKAEFILKRAHPGEAEISRKLLERLEKLGLKGEVDHARLAQEVVLQLERADVSEEAERILEHVIGMSETLLSTDPVGKKLEFYTQELFREFNTVGSKSQDAEITKVVIDSKVIIERLREQVQNIE